MEIIFFFLWDNKCFPSLIFAQTVCLWFFFWFITSPKLCWFLVSGRFLLRCATASSPLFMIFSPHLFHSMTERCAPQRGHQACRRSRSITLTQTPPLGRVSKFLYSCCVFFFVRPVSRRFERAQSVCGSLRWPLTMPWEKNILFVFCF